MSSFYITPEFSCYLMFAANAAQPGRRRVMWQFLAFESILKFDFLAHNYLITLCFKKIF